MGLLKRLLKTRKKKPQWAIVEPKCIGGFRGGKIPETYKRQIEHYEAIVNGEPTDMDEFLDMVEMGLFDDDD